MKKELMTYVRNKNMVSYSGRAHVCISSNSDGDLFIGISIPKTEVLVYIVYRANEIENVVECKKFKLSDIEMELYYVETSDIEVVQAVIHDRLIDNSIPPQRDKDGFIILRRKIRNGNAQKMVYIKIGSSVDPDGELARCVLADIMLDIPCDIVWRYPSYCCIVNPKANIIGVALMQMIPRDELAEPEIECITNILYDFTNSINMESTLNKHRKHPRKYPYQYEELDEPFV